MLESVSQPGGAAVQRSIVGAAAPFSHTLPLSEPLPLQAVQRGTADMVRALLGDQVSPYRCASDLQYAPEIKLPLTCSRTEVSMLSGALEFEQISDLKCCIRKCLDKR